MEQAEQLLKANYDLLLEKSVTMNADEARQLKMLAEQYHRKIYAFHNRVYDNDFLAIQRLIQSGELGDVFHVELHWYESFGAGWGSYGVSDWRISGKAGGLLFDIGAHAFSQIIKLFPEGIATVYAQLQQRGNLKQVDDHSVIHLTSTKNRLATVYLSNFVPSRVPHWLIVGERGTLQSSGPHWKDVDDFILTLNETPQTPKPLHFTSEGWSKIHFYRALRQELGGSGKLDFTFNDAIQVMQLIDAAKESSVTNAVVTVSQRVH